MTQEEKDLLLKDLCARLPYGVKCRFEITTDTYQTKEFSRKGTNGLFVDFDEIWCYWLNEGFVIPYLRPMSSMTEEEKQKYKEKQTYYEFGYFETYDSIDFLNFHHFDYRGLIEKGLALEAPEGMYNFN